VDRGAWTVLVAGVLLAGCGGGGGGTTVGAAIATTTPPVVATTTPAAPTTPVRTTPAAVRTTPAPTTPAPTTAAPVPPCETQQFTAVIGPMQQAQPRTGFRPGVIVLTNTSPTTCSLYGSGEVEMLDAEGLVMFGEGVPGGIERRAPTMLRVAPGTKVYRDMLFWPPGGEPCGVPAEAKITIPEGGTTWLRAPWKGGPLCGLVGQPYRQTAGG
jgi:hypothetical protein